MLNIDTPESMSPREIATTIIKQMGSSSEVRVHKMEGDDFRHYRPGVVLAKKELGFRAAKKLRPSLAEMVRPGDR